MIVALMLEVSVLRRSFPFPTAVISGVAVLTAASAPSPLYPVYQRLWGFSAFTLTVVFAVYVFALIVALLTVGSLSDLVGRRPVASGAFLLLTVGMLLFATAAGTGDLVVARIVQGFAVGAATGTTTAMITETAPSERSGALASSAASPLGIAVGAVLAGTLVEFAPFPRQLVFWVLASVYLLLAASIWVVPEPASSRCSSADWRSIGRSLFPSIGIPASVRPVFRSLVPGIFATWALAGLYLSLGTSVIGTILGVRDHFTASLILGAFFSAGIAGSAVQTALPLRGQRWFGIATLALGVLLTVPATVTASLPLYVTGSVLAGVGFGATFQAALGTLVAAAPGPNRGQVFAAMYVVSYVAFSVPALLAGLAVAAVGLQTTAIGYAVFELVLITLSLTATRRPRQGAAAPHNRS